MYVCECILCFDYINDYKGIYDFNTREKKVSCPLSIQSFLMQIWGLYVEAHLHNRATTHLLEHVDSEVQKLQQTN